MTSPSPTLRRVSADGPIDWRMEFGLDRPSRNGRSSNGHRPHPPHDRVRDTFYRPHGDAAARAADARLVRELLDRVNELKTRIEILENRVALAERVGPGAVSTGDGRHEPSQHTFGDLDETEPTAGRNTGAEALPTEEHHGGSRLTDLPCGPLTIEVVAAALAKKTRTVRGWCQIGKYDFPCHKEGGRWHFYRDEIEVWFPEYETKSRRDSKRAQARRRRTKNGE